MGDVEKVEIEDGREVHEVRRPGDEEKGKLLYAMPHGDKEKAQEDRSNRESEGRVTRVYPRVVTADGVRVPVWVVIVREDEPEGDEREERAP